MSKEEFLEKLRRYVHEEIEFWQMNGDDQVKFMCRSDIEADDEFDIQAWFTNRVQSLHWNFNKCEGNLQEFIYQVM